MMPFLPDYDSEFVLTVGDFGGGVFQLINGSKTYDGFFSSFDDAGSFFSLSDLGSSTSVVIGASANSVPEPSAFMLLSLAGLGCLGLGGRRRQIGQRVEMADHWWGVVNRC